MNPSKILIVDSNAVCYAAFYASGHLVYRQQNTGIIYGFFRQILHACRSQQIAHIVFCWDSRQSHRKRIFSSYKAKRNKENNPELIRSLLQFEQLRKEILPDLGFINNFHITGFEADDLIASICKYPGPEPEQKFIIMSGDQDLYQLLTEQISIYKLNKKRIYSLNEFVREYGISPTLWGQVKTIAGCQTDGIPGVYGIGEKKAIDYIKKKSIPTYKHPKIDSQQSQEIIERNHRLVVLPFQNTPHLELNWTENPSYAKWIELCERFGFNTFLKEGKVWEWLFSGISPENELQARIKIRRSS